MKIRRIQVTVEPWMHAAITGPESVEARFKIDIEGLPDPLHMTEVIRDSDFQTRFQWFMEGIQRRIEKVVRASEEGTLKIEMGKLLIDGEEIGRW